MRKVASWLNFLGCAGWTLCLMFAVLSELYRDHGEGGIPWGGHARGGTDWAEMAIFALAILIPAIAGIYLFAIGANREYTELESINKENQILEARLKQQKLRKELENVGKPGYPVK